MDSQKIQDEENQLQYYGFTSSDFIADFQDLILESIKEATDDLEKLVLPNCSTTKECFNQFKGLYEKYEKNTLEYFKGIEDEIRSYLTIPKHVLLADAENNIPYQQSDLESLNKEIKELEEKYMKERAFNFLCKKEIEILDNLEAILNTTDIENIKKVAKQQIPQSTQARLKIYEKLSTKLSTFNVKSKYVCKSD